MDTTLEIALINRWQTITTATELRAVATIPYADGTPDTITLEFEGHEDIVYWEGHDTASGVTVNTVYAGPAAVASRLLRDIKAMDRGLPVLASLVLEAAAALDDLSTAWGWVSTERFRPTGMDVAHLDVEGTPRGLCAVRGFDDGLYAGWYEPALDRITVDLRPGLALTDALTARRSRVEAVVAAVTLDDSASNEDLLTAGRLDPSLAILAALHRNCDDRMRLRTTADGRDLTRDLMTEVELALLKI